LSWNGFSRIVEAGVGIKHPAKLVWISAEINKNKRKVRFSRIKNEKKPKCLWLMNEEYADLMLTLPWHFLAEGLAKSINNRQIRKNRLKLSRTTQPAFASGMVESESNKSFR
jgi:hypothetical protein